MMQARIFSWGLLWLWQFDLLMLKTCTLKVQLGLPAQYRSMLPYWICALLTTWWLCTVEPDAGYYLLVKRICSWSTIATSIALHCKIFAPDSTCFVSLQMRLVYQEAQQYANLCWNDTLMHNVKKKYKLQCSPVFLFCRKRVQNSKSWTLIC